MTVFNKFQPGCCCQGCECCANCNTPEAWVITLQDDLVASGRVCSDDQCTAINGVEMILKRLLPLEGVIPCCDARDVDCNFGGDTRPCSWYYPVPDHGRQIDCAAANPDCNDGICEPHAWLTMDGCLGGNSQLNLFWGCIGPFDGGPCDGNLTGGDGITWFGPAGGNCCDPQLFVLTGASLFLHCDCLPTLPVDLICSCVLNDVTDICVRPYKMDGTLCRCHGCDDVRSGTCTWDWDVSGMPGLDDPCTDPVANCQPPSEYILLGKPGHCFWRVDFSDTYYLTVELANTAAGDCVDMTSLAPVCDTPPGSPPEYGTGICTYKAVVHNDCFEATYCGSGSITCQAPIFCNLVDGTGSQSCCDPGNEEDALLGCVGLPTQIALSF